MHSVRSIAQKSFKSEAKFKTAIKNEDTIFEEQSKTRRSPNNIEIEIKRQTPLPIIEKVMPYKRDKRTQPIVTPTNNKQKVLKANQPINYDTIGKAINIYHNTSPRYNKDKIFSDENRLQSYDRMTI